MQQGPILGSVSIGARFAWSADGAVRSAAYTEWTDAPAQGRDR